MKVSEVIPAGNIMTWLDGAAGSSFADNAAYRLGILIRCGGVWTVTKAGSYDTAEVERVPEADYDEEPESDDLRAAFEAGWWARNKAWDGDEWEPQYEAFRRELAEDGG